MTKITIEDSDQTRVVFTNVDIDSDKIDKLLNDDSSEYKDINELIKDFSLRVIKYLENKNIEQRLKIAEELCRVFGEDTVFF
ncbi:MAG: hypothetical protein GY861_22135 [bacterium]|nr:hypothetical protein [bacterium]